jgi:imidazole glycerol-phosphate synthase subunit HisH
VKQIGIVETGAGNVASLEAAILRAGHSCVRLSAPPTSLSNLSQLVIPGQGRFGPVMSTLNQRGWTPVLREWIQASQPLLGICVGMQVLFESSEEDAGIAGLGVFSGHVRRLHSPKQPMMGWAPVSFEAGNGEPEGDAYFVNSFVVPHATEAVAATHYGETFVAAIKKGNTVACQFHPEKSGAYGQSLLQKWLVGS